MGKPKREKKDKKQLVYRTEPTTKCPYLLETTPSPHYVGPVYKIVEIVLINQFGKKNIPAGNFWRQVDTSTEVFNFQKPMYAVINRISKTYDFVTIMNMVVRKKLRFLSNKMMARYLYWCKEEKELADKIELAIKQAPVVMPAPIASGIEYKVEKKEDKSLLDWLDE